MENQEKEIEIVDKLDDTKALFLKHYEESLGIITIACQKANISRQTYYDWLKKDDLFAKKISEVEVVQVGMVKDMLLQAIASKDLPSIRFYLERKSPEFKAKAELDVYNREEIDKTLAEIKEFLHAHKPKIIQNTGGDASNTNAKTA